MTGREVSRDCRRQWVVLMLAGLMGACELTEVAIPPSDPIVIVQAIIRPDLNRQWVVVERSLTGAEERQSTPGDIPFDRPQLPIVDASVTVENLSAAESRIRDADVAALSSRLVSSQILQQAGLSVLAQANAAPQAALSLLQ